MTKRTRLIILITCVTLFLVVSPILIMYSMGYRYDFTNSKIVATGGIYVRTFPTADSIVIDSQKTQKPGIFSNSVFTQNLMPGDHSVSIKKDSYFDYYKTLPVLEKEVTKLENVILFKKEITFEPLVDTAKSPFLPENQPEKFTIVGSNLYYSDSTQNDKLTTLQKNTSLIKNLLTFSVSNNNIFWLAPDGFIYETDLASITSPALPTKKPPVKITLKAFNIAKKGSFKITAIAQNIFINNNGSLSVLDTQTKILQNIAEGVKGFEISPDRNNISYFTDKSVYVYDLSGTKKIPTMLLRTAGIATDLIWLNNDYVIFVAGNAITISEIDARGNVNSIVLNQFVSPKIIFNQQESKLYVLSAGKVQVSEKIIP